jgi:signal transduction histidine kinase
MSAAAGARLLIVDDETELVTALSRTLEAHGYATVGAPSGERALEVLRGAASDPDRRFDVLVTDLQMPTMDGIELLRAAQEVDDELVSVVMTGHGTIDTAVQAMKSGALDYILKPFNLKVAVPVLARAVAVRELRMEKSLLVRQLARRTLELETANEELNALNRELDAFSHSVSHELRQPLNHVIGFADLLASGKIGALNAQQTEFFGYIRDGGRRLVRLIDDLLHFSRTSQQPLRGEDVDVEALVREIAADIAAEVATAAPARQLDFRIGALPHAHADPALLRHVLVNLLSNAAKFTRNRPDALIEVTGATSAVESTWCVRDNGAGFDMAASQRLFTIFKRLHNERDFEGTGVGLSLAQRIVRRHGGRIWAQGAVGQGAAFTFALPLAGGSGAPP